MTGDSESSNVEDITLAGVVAQSLKNLQLPATDKAAERLARVYARAIDSDVDHLKDLGPKLLDVLDALGATPRGRSRLKQTGTRNGPSKLQGFRAAG